MNALELITNAIRESKQTNSIVHIRSGGGVSRGTLRCVREELILECEDHVENGDVEEFWGEDDGNEWCVHVER